MTNEPAAKIIHRGREFDSLQEAMDWRAAEDAKEGEGERKEIILRIVEANGADAASTAAFLIRLMQGMDRHSAMSTEWTITVNGEPFQLAFSEHQRMSLYGPCEHCGAARDVRTGASPEGRQDKLWCPSCGREAD